MSLLPSLEGRVEYKTQFRWAVIFLTVAFCTLFIRLFWLQIVQGDKYTKLSKIRYIGNQVLRAPRGEIRDINGIVLAQNSHAYHLYIDPRAFVKKPAQLDYLCSLLGLTLDTKAEIKETIEKALKKKANDRVLIIRDLTEQQYAMLVTELYHFSGVYPEVVYRRMYPLNNVLSHLLGYMNEVQREDLDKFPGLYRTGDIIGRQGLEATFELELKGKDGFEYFVHDAVGVRRNPSDLNIFQGLPQIEPEPGKTLFLTINVHFQKIVMREMADVFSGAVVVMDPKTGRILASYSKPEFDPNDWSGRMTKEKYAKIVKSDNYKYSPMIDKALIAFPPASVYKLVASVGALEEGIITIDNKINCKGHYDYGGRAFGCHSVHGQINIEDAIMVSCDVFFYRLGELLGMDRLEKYGKLLGFGEETGVRLGEQRGQVPSKIWHMQKDKIWLPGYSLSTAVGQKDVKVTPLQMAVAYSALANGGTIFIPQIIDHIEDGNKNVIMVSKPMVKRHLPISKNTMEIIKNGMVKAVNDEKGTAYESHIDDVLMAGKTGTAEAPEKREGAEKDTAFKKWLKLNHAWFVGFAPAEDPEVVVVVFIEHGGVGGQTAAPIARRIVQAYLRQFVTTEE